MSSNLTKALKKSADIVAPVVDEGTVLRIGVPVVHTETGVSTTYTYVAIFANNRWYLSGVGALLNKEYPSTIDLLGALSRHKGVTVDIAVAFETIR